MRNKLAPQTIISLSALLLLAIVTLATYWAMTPPWLGITLATPASGAAPRVVAVDPTGPAAGRLAAGEHLVALGAGGLALTPVDLIEEPDALATFLDYNAFFTRQGELYRVLNQPRLELHLEDGRIETIAPHSHHPITTLPWLFWYQIACGAIVFIAGMGVYAFRPGEQVSLYYAATGFGLLLASSSAAVYSTRELALDGQLFHALSLINQFGSLLFSGTFISILWYYPQRLHRFPFGPVIIGFYMSCWLANLFQLSDSLDMAMRYPILLGLMINLSLALLQWRRSRSQPVQRAILKWFLLAWLTGTTFYVGLHTVPLMLGMHTVITQSLGWGVLVTVYMGIALGITRYRLFNLDRWVMVGWLWFLGGLAVIVLDGLLVSLLEIDTKLALAMTLAIAGWVYFPLRQRLWRLFSGYARRDIDYRELLPSVLTTMLNTRSHELAQEWTGLLQRTFSPLHIERLDTAPAHVHVDSLGSTLTVPALGSIRAQQLSYADRGSRLFNQDDLRLAESMHQLFSHIQRYRDAFNSGVHEERRRVARDLHDDVGAKLLTLVYSADTEQQADLARETLQELRDVIRGLEHHHYTLATTLDELRRETARRCEAHEVVFDWAQPVQLGDYPLVSRQHANLQRMVREAVTNALRHGRPHQLKINIGMTGANLAMQISNDHSGADGGTAATPGRGMRNISARATELGGRAEWQMGKESLLGGYTVAISIPMRGATEHEYRLYP